MWTMTAFLLDRYHRYWMYHPPFVAGWTYGRRQGYFLAVGEPEDANRSLRFELENLDGEGFAFRNRARTSGRSFPLPRAPSKVIIWLVTESSSKKDRSTT